MIVFQTFHQQMRKSKNQIPQLLVFKTPSTILNFHNELSPTLSSLGSLQSSAIQRLQPPINLHLNNPYSASPNTMRRRYKALQRLNNRHLHSIRNLNDTGRYYTTYHVG